MGKREARDELLRAFVIDILHYDLESVETLLSHLNLRETIGWRDFWPHDFAEEEVLPALEKLTNQGLVAVFEYDAITKRLVQVNQVPLEREQNGLLWFGLTENGRCIWEKWTPPENIAHCKSDARDD